MCLCRRIPKAFPYDKIWIKFISELNGGEKNENFIRAQIIYTSPFVYLRSSLVPRRENQPNFWHTHWIRTYPVDFEWSDFCPQCYSSKVSKIITFYFSDEIDCFGFNLLNSYIFKFLGGVTSYENCSVLWLSYPSYLLKLESPLLKDALCQVWLKQA